jgi:hypothetical protein
MSENYPISEQLRIYGILNGTYQNRIPYRLREAWHILAEKNNRGETLSDEEVKFAEEMNSFTCRSKHRQERYEAAKYRTYFPYVITLEKNPNN